MPATALTRLTLTDFRSYGRADVTLDGRPVFLVGPNGAGKTNLLEAISLFTPGRGLRGASLSEVGRRLPGEAQGRAWAVSAQVTADDEPIQLGTGTEQPGAARRVVRIAGEAAPIDQLSFTLIAATVLSLVGAPVVILGRWRRRRRLAVAMLVPWLVFTQAFVLTSLTESGENNRFRFETGTTMVVLSVVVVTSLLSAVISRPRPSALEERLDALGWSEAPAALSGDQAAPEG